MILLTSRQMRALLALNRIIHPYGGSTPIIARPDGAYWTTGTTTIRFAPPAGGVEGIIPLSRLEPALSPRHEHMTLRLDEKGPWRPDDVQDDMRTPRIPLNVRDNGPAAPEPPAARIISLVETILTMDVDRHNPIRLDPMLNPQGIRVWHATPTGMSRGLSAAILTAGQPPVADPRLAPDGEGGLVDYGFDGRTRERLELAGIMTVADVENMSVHHMLNAGARRNIPRLQRIGANTIRQVEIMLAKHNLDPVPERLTERDMQRLGLKKDGTPCADSMSWAHDPTTGLPKGRR